MKKTKITIIGGDSFIARKFYLSVQSEYSWKLFSRVKTNSDHEQVVENFFSIAYEDLKDTDVLINFAAIVHQPKLKDDGLYSRINTDLPAYLVSIAIEAGVQHFIQLSTISVYGKASVISDKTEENPQDMYGITKLAADKHLLSLGKTDIRISLVRPPMVYGGGNSPGNLMRLISLALMGFPLPFKGSRNQRDFIHVENLALCMKQVINYSLEGIIIPTDRRSVPIHSILEIVEKYSQARVRQFRIPRLFHTLFRKLVPTLYSKLFGELQVTCNLDPEIYKPEYTIEEGIREIVEYLEKDIDKS